MRAAGVIGAVLIVWLMALPVAGQMLLVPMDDAQTDHLRAYGLTWWCLQEPRGYECQWLLNYRAGSFVVPDLPDVRARAEEMGVAVAPVSPPDEAEMDATIERSNMQRLHLTKAPKIAVYTPSYTEPWDDAVTLALTYAQVEYDTIWDREVMAGALAQYDWLHLHHEDFTGNYGKFFSSFADQAWYRRQVIESRKAAEELGFPSVQACKKAVAATIAAWVSEGGFLFAMCSAADSLDIALATQGVDIVVAPVDGTPMAPDAQERLDTTATLAFEDFRLIFDPLTPEVANIDVSPGATAMVSQGEVFELFEFSARQDPIPTMLTQCHVGQVADFLGQTTAFRRECLKDSVVVLGDFPGADRVKYIHGGYVEGTFTFLGGHDPEDYAHIIGEDPTDLSLHRHSPGYRLILNNILFPAAKTRERKT
ncbi:MAG: asparagine synthetase B [Armatimonadota bacterium]|nr:asparagine synthetase B [Armatimonadota bacterium]